MRKNNMETEITHLGEELEQVKKENKSLTQKLATANSRKSKLQKALKKKTNRKSNRAKNNYNHSRIVRLSTLLYTRSGCGLRSIIEVLKVVNETFEGILGEIPGYNTIGNWMKKYGLDVYNLSGKSLKGQDYAEVIDGSMMIGSEKLLVTLAVPSAHQGRPLCHSDVSVLDMSVSTGWTGESVKTQLEEDSLSAAANTTYRRSLY